MSVVNLESYLDRRKNFVRVISLEVHSKFRHSCRWEITKEFNARFDSR